jgi:putative ABC transport system substrate-binding protein
MEYRWAEGQLDRLPALAAELVRRQVVVIVAIQSAASPLAAKAATATIPIVFSIGGDAVKLGLMSSLNRPGGNLTGTSFLYNTLAPKRLEMLHELVPNAAVIGFLVNPKNPSSQSETADVQTAARTLGLRMVTQNATSDHDIDAAFAGFVEQRVEAITFAADAVFNKHHDQLIALAARYAVPTMYFAREFVQGRVISRANIFHGWLALYNRFVRHPLEFDRFGHFYGLTATRELKQLYGWARMRGSRRGSFSTL